MAGFPWRLSNWVMCPLVTLTKIWVALMDVMVPSKYTGNFLQVLHKLETRLQTMDSARKASWVIWSCSPVTLLLKMKTLPKRKAT
jgi:hypothetical protein